MTFLIVVVFGGTALWCLLVTPFKRWRFERHAASAVWATARVVGTDSKTQSSFGNADHRRQSVTTYYADLEFTTEEGVIFAIRREISEGSMEKGGQVNVAYQPSDPYEARLDWVNDPWAGNNWAGVFGFVAFAGMGVAFLWGTGAITLG